MDSDRQVSVATTEFIPAQVDPTLNEDLEDPVRSGEDQDDGVEEVLKLVEYFCGLGKCRPKWLQVFRSVYFFTFLICCDILIEGAVATGFLSVTLSTIQRRYDLTSTESGLIVSVFDMAVIASVIFISYFGGKGHKPRWLGVGLLVQGLGCLIFSLPQFVFGPYSASDTGSNIVEACGGTVDSSLLNSSLSPMNRSSRDITESCDTENNDRYALVFFFIGNIFIGLGATPLFTIGPSFIDDIVRPKYVSIHLGVFYALAILGPAVGFGIGAGFLSIYVDFWEDTTLEATDPAYVGAWWLCFLFTSVVSWIIAIPFLMFPRLLPDSHLVQKEREEQMAQRYKEQAAIDKENSTLLKKLMSLPRHFCQIMTTLTWVFITVAVSFSAFAVTGVSIFTPSYYEAQFNLTAATSSIVTGAIAIPTGFVGVMIGSLLVFFAKSSGRRVALINVFVTVIAMPPLLVYLIRCPTPTIAGITQPFERDQFIISDPLSSINATCSLSCNCNFQNNVYQPVCGGDGLTYTSPCRAGCSVTYDQEKLPIYENCTCVEERLRALNLSTSRNFSAEEIARRSVVSEGSCDSGCNSFIPHLLVSVLALLMLFVLEVPDVFITIRCVADEQRTFALGIQSFVFRLFGNIPGPIVFGVVFDIACIFRNFTFLCGSSEATRGACWVYNSELLSHAILAMVLIAMGMNFIFSFLAWVTYPKTQNKIAEGPAQHANGVDLENKSLTSTQVS